MLLSMGKQRHAVQLLQYHVPPDSLRLARMLLDCEEENNPPQSEGTRTALVQAAIDMMMRIRAYNQVVIELLKRGRLMAAMRVVLRRRSLFQEPTTGAGGGNAGSAAVSLSSNQPSIPKEAFFRAAVGQLRASMVRAEDEMDLRKRRRAEAAARDAIEWGDGTENQPVAADTSASTPPPPDSRPRESTPGATSSTNGRLETLHAVYAFYRELWPYLLQPILKPAGSRGQTQPVSTLAASCAFPDDLFHDYRVADMYRSLFGFAPRRV